MSRANCVDPLLRLVLRQGSVFYVQDRHLTSAEPHYFVVLNRSPLADRCLLLAVSSSQIDKVKKRSRENPPETLVEISPSEYGEFSKASIVDCNYIFEKDHATVSQQISKNPSAHKMDLPPAILAKIVAGALLSPVVTGEHKALIG